MSKIYFHINNGGVSFDVTNYEFTSRDSTEPSIICPVLEINANSFGNQLTGMKLYTDARSLKQLGQMLIDEAKNWEDKEKFLFGTQGACSIPLDENYENEDTNGNT